MQRRHWLGSACGLALAPAVTASRLRVRYPRPQRPVELLRWYPLELLHLALQASGLTHELVPSELVMVQSRALRELRERAGAVDVAWSVTSQAREDALQPIRIPIYRGLYGWRVLLVQQGRAQSFANVHSLADLRRRTLLQGHDWPDTEILRANGLPVLTTARYEHLFAMLAHGRADGFPRGVTEVEFELGQAGAGIELEPHLLLHYPTAEYFFVSRHRPELAQALEQGLRSLLEQGELEALLQRHHGAALKELQLGRRRVLRLHNPLLPAATPLQEERLWWRV